MIKGNNKASILDHYDFKNINEDVESLKRSINNHNLNISNKDAMMILDYINVILNINTGFIGSNSRSIGEYI